MNPPAAPRPADAPAPPPTEYLSGSGAPHRLQAGAVPATVLVSITSPPGPAPGRRGQGPACVMRAQRDGVHPSSRHARSARRNPPALDPREPTSHNASPDDLTDSTPPGRAPGRPRAIRPPGSAGFAPGARWGEGRSSSADDRAINGSSGCVGDGPVRGRPPPGAPRPALARGAVRHDGAGLRPGRPLSGRGRALIVLIASAFRPSLPERGGARPPAPHGLRHPERRPGAGGGRVREYPQEVLRGPWGGRTGPGCARGWVGP